MLRALILVAVAAVLAGCAQVEADTLDPRRAYEGPIFDAHLHAFPADGNGPPPLGLCVGVGADLRYDGVRPWPAVLMERFKNPPCADAAFSPTTNEEIRDQTIAIMRERNMRGLLSGRPGLIESYLEAAPELFVPGRGFAIGRDQISPEEMRAEFASGAFEVLAEVTNQYGGIGPADPRFAPYLEMAAANDIPVGIHIYSGGPPGSSALFPALRIQRPTDLQEILSAHPGLRVFIMHAGYPYADDLKAMMNLYPHLYIDTGVLQFALPRAEYYAFLEELVRAGFIDRIMYGTDQMGWPETINWGIDAINDAPFLTYEEKKDILYDNAVRFFRLDTEDGG